MMPDSRSLVFAPGLIRTMRRLFRIPAAPALPPWGEADPMALLTRQIESILAHHEGAEEVSGVQAPRSARPVPPAPGPVEGVSDRGTAECAAPPPSEPSLTEGEGVTSARRSPSRGAPFPLPPPRRAGLERPDPSRPARRPDASPPAPSGTRLPVPSDPAPGGEIPDPGGAGTPSGVSSLFALRARRETAGRPTPATSGFAGEPVVEAASDSNPPASAPVLKSVRTPSQLAALLGAHLEKRPPAGPEAAAGGKVLPGSPASPTEDSPDRPGPAAEPSPDLDALLDQLSDRLEFEYRRTYGTSAD